MAATVGVVVGQFSGATLAAAFTNPSHQDLLQVIKPNDGSIIYNVDYLGVANANPVSPTPDTIIGRFSGSTLALTWRNPEHLDLFQVIAPNDGSVVFYVDYLGVAH